MQISGSRYRKHSSRAALQPLQQLVLVLALLSACSLTLANAEELDSKPTIDYSRSSCAQECAERDCDTIALRYGKFCGVGHGGCPGEEPCDEVDACCKQHDDCVGGSSVLDAECHTDFVACLDQVMLSGSKGFSKTCPYSMVIPTMKNGMEITLMFGNLFNTVGKELEARGGSDGTKAGSKSQSKLASS